MDSSLELLRIPSPSGDWECQNSSGDSLQSTHKRSMGGVEDGWIAHPCGIDLLVDVLCSLACKQR